MGCCGGRRNGARAGRATPADSSRSVSLQAPAAAGGLESPPSRGRQGGVPPRPSFRYEGRTALSVIGGATGTRYRFDHPGATVETDPRDLPSLARVPGLRQVTAR